MAWKSQAQHEHWKKGRKKKRRKGREGRGRKPNVSSHEISSTTRYIKT